MLTPVNLQRAARRVLLRCGTEAPQRALLRAQALRAKGQHRSAETWKDIAAAAARLLADQPQVAAPA